jgi:uncharacterized protein
MYKRIPAAFLLAFASVAVMPASTIAAPPSTDLPAAIFADPPLDSIHPASGQGVQFYSDGALINAQLYRPRGDGPHPTVILLHGLPGNEQNLDAAQVIRRAGWTVITFHYRGSWGSGGKFTLGGGVDDAHALLKHLHEAKSAANWGVDPNRIVLMGHSYGGFVAARTAADSPGLIGVALIAPWDVSLDERTWKPLTAARRKAVALETFDDVDGRLGTANALSLLDEVLREGPRLDLAQLAESLAQQRLLLITATRDTDDDKAIDLLPALRHFGARYLTTAQLDTDHGFNDQRIALEVRVLRWLQALPGAPSEAAP